jgi:hypothetical protein
MQKSNTHSLENIIRYLISLRIPILIKNMAKESKGEEVYNKYRNALDSIQERIPDLNQISDIAYMKIFNKVIGPFTIYSMETYYFVVSERLKLHCIEVTTERFYKYIKLLP